MICHSATYAQVHAICRLAASLRSIISFLRKHSQATVASVGELNITMVGIQLVGIACCVVPGPG